jgi:hypothetical protein
MMRHQPQAGGSGHAWRRIELAEEHVRHINESVAKLRGGRWHRLMVACRLKSEHPYVGLLLEDAAWAESRARALRAHIYQVMRRA